MHNGRLMPAAALVIKSRLALFRLLKWDVTSFLSSVNFSAKIKTAYFSSFLKLGQFHRKKPTIKCSRNSKSFDAIYFSSEF